MPEAEIRAAIERHWSAFAAGDREAEHEIYYEDALRVYPQSGERIRGRRNMLALCSHDPEERPAVRVRRIYGSGQLWVTEFFMRRGSEMHLALSIMEFRGDKVIRETQYVSEISAAPSWRIPWVERIE